MVPGPRLLVMVAVLLMAGLAASFAKGMEKWWLASCVVVGVVAVAVEVAALMAAEVALGVEKQTGTPVIIEAAILQRVLEAHVRQHLDALADLRVSLG